MPSSHGGARPRTGPKPRAGVGVSRHIKLSLTRDELERVRAVLPADAELAAWLREVLLERAAELRRKAR